MRNKISAYFPIEIENKITSQKFIMVKSCSFYQILGLVQKCAIFVVNTRRNKPAVSDVFVMDEKIEI